MATHDYPELEQFLGAYFHQDWAADGATWQAVVVQFTAHAKADALRTVLQEIDCLLRERRSDRALQARLEELGCCYQATGTRQPATRWLRRVAGEFRTALQARGLPPAQCSRS